MEQSEIEYGKCHCGCGGNTKPSTVTNANKGLKKGEPLRFIRNHQQRKDHSSMQPANPSGLCCCGCGGVAPIAQMTNTKLGYVKGQPMRYIYNHQINIPGVNRPALPPPNPGGKCLCGCGRTTKISDVTSTKTGNVRGEHMKWLSGHNQKYHVLHPDVPFGYRRCAEGGHIKPESEFKIQRRKGRSDKRSSVCRDCINLVSAKWREKNADIIRPYTHHQNLMAKFKISRQEYEGMLKAQNGQCGICGGDETTSLRKDGSVNHFSVDHVHEEGEGIGIRGLLCNRCNRALGMFNDDPVLLRSALRWSQKKPILFRSD